MEQPTIANIPLAEAVQIMDGTRERELDAQKSNINLALSERREAQKQARHLRAKVEAGANPAVLPTLAALTPHERKNYSVRRLIESQLQNRRKREFTPAANTVPLSLEHEIALALAQDLEPSGILPPVIGASFIPLQIQASGLDTKTNAEGHYLVGDRILDPIEYLRNASVVLRLGAEMLSGLKGGVGIPVQSAASSASWVSENPGSDVAQTDSSFGQIRPAPKTLQSTTAYSRQLLSESSIDVERFLRRDLAQASAAGLDAGAINGTGTSGQPVGLLRVADTNSYAIGTDGGAPTGLALSSLEQMIADNNADLGPLGWATTPTMRNKLRQTPLFTNSTVPCWVSDEGVDYCLGQRAIVSRNIPQGLTKGVNNDAHAIVAGFWPAMAIAQWSVLAILPDEFAQKRRVLIEVTSYLLCDVAIRRPQCFGIIADARNV